MKNIVIDDSKSIYESIDFSNNNIIILFTNITDNIVNNNIIETLFEQKDIYERIVYNYLNDLEFKHYHLYSKDSLNVFLFKITEKYNYKFINDQLYKLYFDILKLIGNKKDYNLYTYLEFQDNNIIDCFMDILNLLSKKMDVFLLKNNKK